MVVSPYLSTQLNETICGCYCGCGCGCVGHGNDDDYDRVDGESETAVESSDSDDEGGFPSDHQIRHDELQGDESTHLEEDILSPRDTSHQGLFWLLGRNEEPEAGEPLTGWEHVSVRLPLHDDLEDTTNSMFNEAPNTDSRSNAISDHGSLRIMSPGPGIGALFVSDGVWDEEVELVYYFDVRPLRLSAEYEHARGKAVEHLLMPDEVSFIGLER